MKSMLTISELRADVNRAQVSRGVVLVAPSGGGVFIAVDGTISCLLAENLPPTLGAVPIDPNGRVWRAWVIDARSGKAVIAEVRLPKRSKKKRALA